jgi:DnaJ domain
MQLKDYYRILGVLPSATPQQVKEAFRAAAKQYHPDKNPENKFAEAQFKEVQEAYAILSHGHKRQKYDEERWLAGMGSRAQDKQIISPEWLLAESRRLQEHILVIDTYRMSHAALRDYLSLLLSDAHIGVLRKCNDEIINDQIVTTILASVERLDVAFSGPVYERLRLVGEGNDHLLQMIREHQLRKIQKHKQKRSLPWIIAIATLAICLLMYWYGSRH